MTTNPSPPLPGTQRASSRQQHLATVRARTFNLVLGASILAFGAIAATSHAGHGNLLVNSSEVSRSGERGDDQVTIKTVNGNVHKPHVRTRSS